jgi:putative restriction endonuclease
MRWSRDELLLAMHLYERIPFGRQHARDREVLGLAERLGRTPGSVAMKLNNLTSLDPEEEARGVRGLVGASRLDRAVWTEFRARPEVVEEAEALWTAVTPSHRHVVVDEPGWEGDTEGTAPRSVRLAQDYFRRVVRANFEGRCALTGVATTALLVASHIVPWSDAPEHRVNTANGLLLNRLHDGVFDRAMVTFDASQRLVIGRRLRDSLGDDEPSRMLLRSEGAPLRPPVRRAIDPGLLERHRRRFEALEAA